MRQIKQKDWDRLSEGYEELAIVRGQIEDYIEEVKERLAELQAKANELREGVYGQLDDLVNEAQEHFDGRSEKWQRGETGEQYSGWIRELEDARDTLAEDIVLDVDQGLDLSTFDLIADALNGGFRQSPEE